MIQSSYISGETTIQSKQSSQLIKLYCSWFCPYAQRVWIALEELSLNYQYIEINPYKSTDDNHTYTKISLSLQDKKLLYPEFIETSPQGLVPAIRYTDPCKDIDDKVCDSMVCLEYINEIFGDISGNSLLPSIDYPGQRARLRYWAVFANDKIIPYFYKMLMSETSDGREKAKANILDNLQEFARAMSPLSEGPFFNGATFSIVDIVLAPWWQRLLSVAKEYRGFEIPTEPTLDEFTRLRKWYEAVSSRESFRKTVVDVHKLLRNYSGYADNSATSDVAR